MTDEIDPPQLPPTHRIETEIRALGRCLMPHEDGSHSQKLVTLLFVAGWLVWSIGLAQGILERGNTVLWGYTVYELFSFTVVYMFARLHDLEVENLLGTNISVTRDTGDEPDCSNDSED